jgi:N-acetylneuraminate lyase
MINKFRGIFPALVTPYTKEGNINEKSLREIIRINLKNKISGFYVNGSSAETFLLNIEERKQILDIVFDEIGGNCALIYHVGSIATKEALELAKYGESIGVDAISAVPPFYYNFNFNEIKEYYIDLVESVNIPMIIYYFPAFSGAQLSIDNINELLIDDRVIGIKYTSINLYHLERIKNNKVLFNGFDEILLGGLSMGADGGIGSTYNFMADKFVKIYNLYNDNKIKEALKIQKEANNIIDVLKKVGVIQGVKYALEGMGIECNGCRKPFKNLNDEDKRLLDFIFEKNGISNSARTPHL